MEDFCPAINTFSIFWRIRAISGVFERKIDRRIGFLPPLDALVVVEEFYSRLCLAGAWLLRMETV